MTTTNRPVSTSDDASSELPADESAVPSPDDVFHILQTSRRRETIRYMLRADDTVRMRDIAEHVAAREHETTVAALTSAQRQRVYIPLYQSHLPKLDEAGVIDYDKPRGIVRPAEHLDAFRSYLEDEPTAPTADEGGGCDRQFVVLGASVSLLLASTVGVVPLSGLAVSAIITALFVLTSVAF